MSRIVSEKVAPRPRAGRKPDRSRADLRAAASRLYPAWSAHPSREQGLGSPHSFAEAILDRTRLTVEHLIEANPSALVRASAAPSGSEFFAILAEELSHIPRVHSSATAAKLRAVRIREKLLHQEGGCASSTDAAKILRITRQAVDVRIKKGQLLGLHAARREALVPVWQFTEEGTVLPGLAQTLAALSRFDPWMKLMFFLGHLPGLPGRTALQALRAGDIEAVLDAASSYGEQGGQ